MSDRRLDQLRRQLAGAETVAEVKRAHDRVSALADEAVAAHDFAFLDECTAIRLACTRKGGAMLLAGAERVRGIDAAAAEQWCKRALVAESNFAAAVRRAQSMLRRRAGEPPPPRAARPRDQGVPQARTVVSDWCVDEFGNPTRFVVGVCARQFKQMTAAGERPDKVQAELLADALERAA